MILYGTEAFEKFRMEEAEHFETPNKDRLEGIPAKQKKLSGFAPVCQLIPIYEVSQMPSANIKEYKYKLTSTDVILLYKGIELTVFTRFTPVGVKTPYTLHLREEIQHTYLKYFDPAHYGLNMPQKIGAATEKKMDIWLEYLAEVEKVKQAFIQEKKEKVQDFQNRLAPLKKKIRWIKEKQQGYIKQGGAIYRFTIDELGGITEDVELYRGTKDLSYFLLLTSNKLNQPHPGKTNSEIMDLASELAEKEMSDTFKKLPEEFYDGENYKEEYQDLFNPLYDKYYSLICQIANFEYDPMKTEEEA